MVVDVLGPMFCSVVVAAEFVPDLWLESLELTFLGTLGACGFWQNGGRARCTFAATPVRIPGECALIV